jgi:hypothetical protein
MTRHDRGVAGMLDFLTAVVVVVGAIAVYFTAASALVDAQQSNADTAEQVSGRASERLVEDMLVASPDAELLAPGCSRAVFGTTPNRSCAIAAEDDGQEYLRDALGVGPGYRVNVTIEDEDGVVTAAHGDSDPYRHALGPSVPPRSDVAVAARLVSFGSDDDGDGRVEYYTATVSVWEGQ